MKTLTTVQSGMAVENVAIGRPAGGATIKRGFDFCGAVFLFLMTLPVLSLIALIIKIDSRGPVFFRQPRVGLNGKIFWIWKFRTMHHAKADLSGSMLTVRNDPRLTRCGKWLRAYSLDELPQLLNVISGDMSLVGPRPHPVDAKAAGRRYSDVVVNYAMRHCVRPGITGWAQVNGWRGETSTAFQIEQRVAYDFEYITRMSIRFDILILFRTIREVWRQDSF